MVMPFSLALVRATRQRNGLHLASSLLIPTQQWIPLFWHFQSPLLSLPWSGRSMVSLQPFHTSISEACYVSGLSSGVNGSSLLSHGFKNKEISSKKYEVKLKICKALKNKDDVAALQHLVDLLKMACEITNADYLLILRLCTLHNNGKVAKEIWRHMGEKKLKLNGQSLQYLLRALSRSGFLDEAMELLSNLQMYTDNIPLTTTFCNIYLNGCSRIPSIQHAETCLKLMQQNGVAKDDVTYLELIKIASQKKDLRAIKKAWVELLKIRTPSIDHFYTLIVNLSEMGCYVEALLAYRELLFVISKEAITLRREKNPGLSKDEHSKQLLPECKSEENSDESKKSSLTWSAATLLGKVDSSQLSMAPKSGLSGESCSVRYFHIVNDIEGWTRHALDPMDTIRDKQNLKGKKASIMASIVPECFRLDMLPRLESLPHYAQKVLTDSLNSVINSAVGRKDFELSEQLFSQMQEIGLKPTIYTYNAIIRSAVRSRGLHHAFGLIGTLESNGLEPNAKTYDAIMEGFCMKMELEKAEALLDRMFAGNRSQQPSCFSFNILMNACAEMDDVSRALRVFAKMARAGVKPDQCTAFVLISIFGITRYPRDSSTIRTRNELSRRLFTIDTYLSKFNVLHSQRSLTAMLSVLGVEGMVDNVLQNLRKAEEKIADNDDDALDVFCYNVAIHGCIQSGELDAAENIFKRMHRLGFDPDVCTYNTLMNGFCEAQRLDMAFMLVDVMKKKGLKPDLTTLNTLLKAVSHNNNMEMALSLLKDMRMAGLRPNVITYNTLISSATFHNHLELMELLLEMMRFDKVRPDMRTCEYVVSAYAKSEQVDDAVEALIVLSSRMMPDEVQSRPQIMDMLQTMFTEDSAKNNENTFELLKECLFSKSHVAQPLLTMRLAGLSGVDGIPCSEDSRSWEKRLHEQYTRAHHIFQMT